MKLSQIHALLSEPKTQATLNLDAGETMSLARQLLYVRTATYDIQYPTLLGKQLVPVSNEISNGANRHSYKSRDRVGKAKVISSYADDLPRASAFVKETTAPIKSIGASYGYSIQELRAAAFYNEPLDRNEAEAARMSIEEGLDEAIAVGIPNAGVYGLTNNPDVETSTPAGMWTPGVTTGVQMVADLNLAVQAIVTQTNQINAPTDIIIAPNAYGALSETYVGTAGLETALSLFLRTNPYIKRVRQWYRLANAGVGGVSRTVIYQADPTILTADIPQEFEQFPPEMRNLEYVINCHARTAGVTMFRPKAVRYMDGL